MTKQITPVVKHFQLITMPAHVANFDWLPVDVVIIAALKNKPENNFILQRDDTKKIIY